jgi:hypothetical protein
MKFIRSYLDGISAVDLDEQHYALLERIVAREPMLKEIPADKLSFLCDLLAREESLGRDTEHSKDLQALIIGATAQSMKSAHRKKK